MTDEPAEDHRKAIIAATWKSKEESFNNDDPVYHAFVSLMKMRREIANKYLSANSSEEREEIRFVLTRYNDDIKRVLGL